jgi:hypothetical protein
VKWFRKNKKQMLAILTILTVLSFIFVPIFLQILESRRGSKDPLVVSTKKYSDLSESQVRFLLWQRGRWVNFIQGLQRLVAQHKGGQFLFAAQYGMLRIPDGTGRMVTIAAPDGLYLILGGQLARVGSESEAAVVETWLLCRKARDMGFTSSYGTIKELLTQWTQQRVSSAELQTLANSYSLSPSQLFDIIGNELAAIRARGILRASLGQPTPAQRWDYFQRLNRSARIEAVPIDVEKLIAQVPDPTAAEEKELKALFEKYKEKLPDPESPDPGFREFHQIVVQYFKAEMRTFLDPREVTDEEILKYYNEHKEDKYTRLVSQDLAKVLPEKPAAPGEKAPAGPGKPETPKAEPPKSAGAKAEAGKPDAAKTPPAPATPAKPETPKAPAEKPGAPAKAAPKTSSIEGRGLVPLRFVSLQEDRGQKAEDRGQKADGRGQNSVEPKSTAPKPEPAAAKPTAPKPEPAAAKPTAPKPEPAAAKPTAPESQIPKANSETPTPKSQVPSPKSQVPSPPAKAEPAPRAKVEVVPLEKVKDGIRAELAKQKARDKMAKAFEAVQKRMERFDQDTWIPYIQLTEKERKEKNIASPPDPPFEDLARIMKANRLVPGCTGWVSALDVAEWDIGKSGIEKFQGGSSFIDRAFSQIPVYQAMTSEDQDGNLYLFWKLDDYPERVPEWDDPGVRARVVHAWKLDKARKLARDEAEGIAAKARQSAKPLKEVAATLGGTGVSPVPSSTGKMPVPPTVLTTSPFTWMVDPTMGGYFPYGSPHLGEVKEADGKPIPHLGDPFMARVFSTPQGGTNWAENLPQTIVYVVRVIEYKPLDSTLWEEFLVTPFQAYRMAAIYDEGAADEAWRKEFETEAGLQWHREAARARVEADTESD